MMEYKLRHVGCTDTERLLCASYIILGHIPAHNSIPVFLTLNYTPGNFPATTLTLAISCSLYSFTFILTWFTCKTIWWLYFELLQLTHGKNRHTQINVNQALNIQTRCYQIICASAHSPPVCAACTSQRITALWRRSCPIMLDLKDNVFETQREDEDGEEDVPKWGT